MRFKVVAMAVCVFVTGQGLQCKFCYT